jgi:hypothetical protein
MSRWRIIGWPNTAGFEMPCRQRVNLVAGILYASLIIIPWFLALSAR